jgi:DNA invertase Pin-like site-specific DNA recombinase
LIDQQIDALTAAGWEKIFTDTMSGSRNDRPGLKQALEFVRSGDSICVWRLDRLALSEQETSRRKKEAAMRQRADNSCIAEDKICHK